MKKLDISGDLATLLELEFSGLHSGGGRSSIAGGQSAADAALTSLNISGYAKNRSEVLPVHLRGATVLSPYIRHNLLTLQQVWDHVAKAPFADKEKYRDLTVYIGDPIEFAANNDVAVTFAPVPSFAKFHNLAQVHPYPWLKRPHAHSVRSFSSWRNKLGK